jgi:endonuclease/exonuclease/phosphatase (EEP) superfamily protein YafD
MATLRILSANLLVDRAHSDDLRQVIAASDPDVIATQEMGPRTASVIRETHNHGHLDPRRDYYGMGIATKVETQVQRLELEDRSGWTANVGGIQVVNVHLINPVDPPWSEKKRTRRRQIEQITEYVAMLDGPYVIIGDMNASPRWPEYRLLAELGSDAARATDSERPTWGPFRWGPRLLRIDHAFLLGARPIATSIAKISGTDHRALIVDIETAD